MTALKKFEISWRKDAITYYLGAVDWSVSNGILVIVHGRSRSVNRLAEAFNEGAGVHGYTVLGLSRRNIRLRDPWTEATSKPDLAAFRAKFTDLFYGAP